jgi:hypothetical protein
MHVSQSQTSGLCTCQQLDNGIYDIVYTESSHQAAEEYLAHLDWLYDGKTPQDPTVRVMVDVSVSEQLPLNQMLPKIREFIRNHPYRPPTRNVYLLSDNCYAHFLDTFVNMLRAPRDRVRYFNSSKRDEAIAWLLADD